MADQDHSAETLLVHAGNHPEDNHGIINPPVYHASTVLFPTLERFEQAQRDRTVGVAYGRSGTPTTFALKEAIAALEGGSRALALPSGLAAISATLMSLLSAATIC
jgi:cystathionine beta-lyase